jgi:hypothetical protein
MPSDPDTWAELKTSLANWLNRDDLNTTEIPEAISLFERRAQRTIFAPEREIVADLTVDAEEESLPADLWGLKAIHLSTDPKTVLEQMTLADLRNTYSASTTGKPQNYAIRGEKIIFGPAPDTAYTAKLSYIQTIPALTDANTTNWLLTDHPDVYVHGALAELHLLLGDETRAAIHDRVMGRIASEIGASSIRRTQGSAPIRIRPSQVV